MTNDPILFENLAVLANTTELITRVIQRVAGNDVSNHLEGVPVTDAAISGVVISCMNKALCAGDDHA